MPDQHTGAPGLHSALVRHTGYLLSRMGWFASRRFSERLQSLGLTPRMWGALNVLEAESPISQQGLGRAIGMDPSSMVGTIDELESLGLVERRPNPSDRRAHALYMTEDGRRTLAAGRRQSKLAQEELLAPLSESERTQLHDLLMRLAEGADVTGPDAVRNPNEPPPRPAA
jgi:MarR family transcriptional regulator, lower aerobic nicotinate degradation pathway regulator